MALNVKDIKDIKEIKDIKDIKDNFFCPDSTFKIIVVGGSNAGKSSLLNRLKGDIFHQDECSTLGIDFMVKSVEYCGKNIKLQIWDTAGQDKFNSICKTYYRGTHCAVICFDVQNRDSYFRALEYLEDVDELCKKNCVKILVATKWDSQDINCDVGSWEISSLEHKMDTVYQKVKCLHTSALNNLGIDLLLEEIVKKLCDASDRGLISNTPRVTFDNNVHMQIVESNSIVSTNSLTSKCCGSI